MREQIKLEKTELKYGTTSYNKRAIYESQRGKNTKSGKIARTLAKLENIECKFMSEAKKAKKAESISVWKAERKAERIAKRKK